MGNALTDSLPRWDPKSQELAYNNTTDRMRMELPEFGDIAASGCVAVITASGTHAIPVYLDSPIPVAVAVDIQSDSIKVFGYDGGDNIPVYLSTHLDESTDDVRIFSSSGTAAIETYLSSACQITAQITASTIENTWSQLTEPSSTASLYVMNNLKHTFQYIVANIDTNVKVAASGSLDNASWFNLDANDSLTTQTTDGTYGFTFEGIIKYTLFSFMEETGGTGATIDVKYLGGR